MGINIPPPPPPPSPRGRKKDMKSKLTVNVDGKNIDLEDAFDVFEDIFEDLEDTFSHMEDTFSRVDSNIGSKLNELKMRIAVKKPEKYDFIPNSLSEKDKMEEKWTKAINHVSIRAYIAKRNLMLITLIAVSLIILFVGMTVILSDSNDTEKAVIEQIQTPTSAGDSSL